MDIFAYWDELRGILKMQDHSTSQQMSSTGLVCFAGEKDRDNMFWALGNH
jgi:hypothetical protein